MLYSIRLLASFWLLTAAIDLAGQSPGVLYLFHWRRCIGQKLLEGFGLIHDIGIFHGAQGLVGNTMLAQEAGGLVKLGEGEAGGRGYFWLGAPTLDVSVGRSGILALLRCKSLIS